MKRHEPMSCCGEVLDPALATTTTGASDSQPADPPDSASTLAHCLPLFLKAKSAGYPQPQTIRNLGRSQPDLQNHACTKETTKSGINFLTKVGKHLPAATCFATGKLGLAARQSVLIASPQQAKSARTAGAEALRALPGSSCNSQKLLYNYI